MFDWDEPLDEQRPDDPWDVAIAMLDGRQITCEVVGTPTLECWVRA